jgi:hypothetical protein
MKALFAVASIAFCQLAFAQTRWCSITGKAKDNSLVYPPIARAAHIDGIVIGRLHFATNGKVENFQVVSGPPILANSVTDQIKLWTVQTNAQGTEPCQSLFVVTFAIGDSKVNEEGLPTNHPGIFRVSVRTEPLILYSTPTAVAVR